eukprot:4377-Eustigmatos_ZCMA.PRE.1
MKAAAWHVLLKGPETLNTAFCARVAITEYCNTTCASTICPCLQRAILLKKRKGNHVPVSIGSTS